MSDTSDHLGLPYLQPQQAQKHVTLNEALRQLDMIVHLAVKANSQPAPPASPQAGDRYIVGPDAIDAFAGQDGKIAAYVDDAWIFITPRIGWTTFVEADDTVIVLTPTGWTPIGQPQSLPTLGINAVADMSNRFSVSADGSLFNHETGDHRLVVNKGSTGDTASLLFQTGFSGRAELGLAGDDSMAIKTSEDGILWQNRLAFPNGDKAAVAPAFRTGEVPIGHDEAVDIPTPASGGFFLFFRGDASQFPQIGDSGIYLFDSGGSPAITEVYGGPNVSNEGVTILTGTDGTPDKTCISVGDGKIYLENRRSQTTVSYRFVFLC